MIACALLLAGCGTAPLGNGPDGVLEEDEHRLWSTIEAEEKRLDQSGLLYTDPEVTGYLNAVLHKLSPPESSPGPLSLEVRVLKNPLLNAFAFPNGKIYVHTGMLARIENEAQLATLLGHELTHATHRHTIQELRGVRRTSAALATLQMVTLPFGVFGLAATSLGTIGYMSAVTGYSRGKELEADRVGLGLMMRAGYTPQEAPKLFEHLKLELAFRKVEEPFFFGSHPRIQDRIDSYATLTEKDTPGRGGITEADEYQRIMAPLIIDNAETDMAIGRLDLAQRDLERVVTRNGHPARAHFLLGEIFRQRKEPGDTELSIAHYRKAIETDPRLPEPYRGLGYALLKQGSRDGALTALRQYLDLSPQAADRGYVEQALKESP